MELGRIMTIMYSVVWTTCYGLPALIEFSSKQVTRPDDCLHTELEVLWNILPNT